MSRIAEIRRATPSLLRVGLAQAVAYRGEFLIWILSTNSWMQTPAGYALENGRFVPVDWMAIIFNPSFPYRLAHTVTGFYVATGFVVLSVGAYYLRRGRFVDEAHFRADAALHLMWVPKGQPALVDSTSPRWGEKASDYSAVCLETGAVEVMGLEGTSCAATSVAFLKQLRAKQERHGQPAHPPVVLE